MFSDYQYSRILIDEQRALLASQEALLTNVAGADIVCRPSLFARFRMVFAGVPRFAVREPREMSNVAAEPTAGTLGTLIGRD